MSTETERKKEQPPIGGFLIDAKETFMPGHRSRASSCDR